MSREESEVAVVLPIWAINRIGSFLDLEQDDEEIVEIAQLFNGLEFFNPEPLESYDEDEDEDAEPVWMVNGRDIRNETNDDWMYEI